MRCVKGFPESHQGVLYQYHEAYMEMMIEMYYNDLCLVMDL